MTKNISIPNDIVLWARDIAEPGEVKTDSTGQKWRYGGVERDVVPAPDSPGYRLYVAARDAVDAGENQGVIFDRIDLRRVDD